MDSKQAAAAIVRAMEHAGYRVDRGSGEINIVYIEGMEMNWTPNTNVPNQFNDLRTVVKFVGGVPTLAGVWEGTTEPSKRWTEGPMNQGGAARIKFGQYMAWQVGFHHNDPEHEALVQTGGEVIVYRDKDKNYLRGGDKEDKGFFGINQHHGYDLPHDNIGNAGAGCLVGRSKIGHKQFMAIVKSDPRYRSNNKFVFSTCVFPAGDILLAAGQIPVVPATVLPAQNIYISKDAEDLIVAEEVTSKSVYDVRYMRPTWPEGESGVTIGIGYDVGYCEDVEQLHRDWKGYIPEGMIGVLEPAVGVTGEAAHRLTQRIKGSVSVPWDAAIAVFRQVDVPKWYKICTAKLPNFESLSLDCRGALVSLAYNRGASFQSSGDRYREMRAIREHMADKDFAAIPDEFRRMKRLWEGKGLDGLLQRRDREADLFERGLSKPVAPVAEGKGQAGVGSAATVIVAGTAAGTIDAVKHPQAWSWGDVALAGFCLVAIAAIVFMIVRYIRKRSV